VSTMSRRMKIIVLPLAAALAGCTNLRQCAQFEPNSAEHSACIQKQYHDAANASALSVYGSLYQH